MSEEDAQKKDAAPSIFANAAYAASATTATHPLRRLLNVAGNYPNPYITFARSYRTLASGYSANLVRGTAAVGLLGTVYAHTKQYGDAVAIPAAAAAGTMVATVKETELIRKNNEERTGTKLINLTQTIRRELGRSTIAGPSLVVFSPTLSLLYFLREVGFSISVLAGKNNSPATQAAILAASTYFTAGVHKFATVVATRDMIPPTETLPTMKECMDKNIGFRGVMKNLIQGNVYTHPALSTYYLNPTTSWQRTANGLSLFCGPNMFFFRFAFLVTYRGVYKFTVEHYPTVKETVSNWSHSFFKATTQSQTIANNMGNTLNKYDKKSRGPGPGLR